MKKNQHPLYPTWASMKQRCYNENRPGYEYYGGRGIRVCERWIHSFEAFAEDMGDKPSPAHSLDRIDNDGPYSPDNCRWATQKEQGQNMINYHRARVRFFGPMRYKNNRLTVR